MKKMFIFSIIGVLVCSAFCIGYSNKQDATVSINTQDPVVSFGNMKDEVDPNNYWDNTPIEEIRGSILGYIDNMMELTVTKLEDFKRENNEDKIKLYENEIKRLNKILNNINSAKTKSDLKEAMQVRHKEVV